MWKPGSKWIAALLIGGAIACSDSATAPTVTPVDGAALYVGGDGGYVPYQGSCGLYMHEAEAEQSYVSPATPPITGTGECGVSPWGVANLRFEGYEVPGAAQEVYIGTLEYDFGDGNKLYSSAWMMYWGDEWLASGGYFSQQFTGGTGAFSRVIGGAGYGDGMFNEELYRANYTSTGNVLFAPFVQ